MSWKFCRCGPLPANCARKIAGPLIVCTLPLRRRRLVSKLLEVVAADLDRLEDRAGERLFLLIEECLGAVRLGGAQPLLPVDRASAERDGGRILVGRRALRDVLDVQR